MKVERMKEILNNLDNDDEIIVLWWDYEEVGDRAEEEGITLSKRAWKKVVRAFDRKLDADQSALEFIDERVREFGDHDDCCDCDDCEDSEF